MVKIIEYRIFMPFTVEENQIGQLWSFAETSRLNTGGGEGVEIIRNEFFKIPQYQEINNNLSHQINFKHLPDYNDHEAQQSAANNSKVKKVHFW